MREKTKSKFKVGDKVRILNGYKIPDYRGGFVPAMSEYVGMIVTIKKVLNPTDSCGYGYTMNELTFTWDERGLELAEKPNNETIVIYRKDNEVIAMDKRTGGKAVATCHPDDEFDFNVGATLAFNRLMDNAVEVTEKSKKFEPLFKIGDVVAMNCDYYTVPKGTRGHVAWVNGINDDMMVIDFHAEYSDTHYCSGKLSEPTGLWLYPMSIRKVK